MQFADLTDTNFTFSCEFAGDACEYWDYDFYVECFDDKFVKNLSHDDIITLKDNCKRILKALNGFEEGY